MAYQYRSLYKTTGTGLSVGIAAVSLTPTTPFVAISGASMLILRIWGGDTDETLDGGSSLLFSKDGVLPLYASAGSGPLTTSPALTTIVVGPQSGSPATEARPQVVLVYPTSASMRGFSAPYFGLGLSTTTVPSGAVFVEIIGVYELNALPYPGMTF